MGASAGRILLATAACLLWLNGCETSTKLGDLFQKSETTQSTFPAPAGEGDPAATGTVPPGSGEPPPLDAVPKGLLGKDPNDDLSLGKK